MESRDAGRAIAVASVNVFLTVLAVSVLRSNITEFVGRFTAPGDVLAISHFDTVHYVAFLVVGVAAGIAHDKTRRRRPFVITGSAGAAASFIVLVLVQDFASLLVARFVQGAFTVLCWQGFMTIALDASAGERRGRHMGIFGAAMMVSMGAGTFVGGLLANAGLLVPYFAAAACNVAVLLVSGGLLQDPVHVERKPALRESLAILARRPRVLVPCIFNLVDRLHMGFLVFVIPVFVATVLGLDPSIRGAVLGLNALPAILLQYPVGKLSDKRGRVAPLVAGSVAFGTVMMLAGPVGVFGIVPFVIMMFALGVGSGLTAAPAMALLGDLVDSHDNGMAMAAFNFFGNVGIILGPVIGGLVGQLDFVLAFLVAGAIELGSLATNMVLLKYLPGGE